MLYLQENDKEKHEETSIHDQTSNVVEDEIDVLLSHESGLIQRKKDPQLYDFIH